MRCSFVERADWAADAESQQYGFMFVAAVGIVWGCVMEGGILCLCLFVFMVLRVILF